MLPTSCWCPTLMQKYRGFWWQKRSKSSPASQSYRQHISPTSVTNIDAAEAKAHDSWFMAHESWTSRYKTKFDYFDCFKFSGSSSILSIRFAQPNFTHKVIGSYYRVETFSTEEEHFIEASCLASNLWPLHVNFEVESRSPQETGDVTQM